MKRSNAEYLVMHKRKHKLLAFAALGGVCCKCNEDDIRVLEIDHIENDGHKEKCARDATYYKKVAKNEGNRYQLLCSNCHKIKTWEANRK